MRHNKACVAKSDGNDLKLSSSGRKYENGFSFTPSGAVLMNRPMGCFLGSRSTAAPR